MAIYEDRWQEKYPGSIYCPIMTGLFEDYRTGCSNFVETGTAGSSGLVHAFKVGFDNFYSVDVDKGFYNDAMYMFEENDNVTLVHGDSSEALKVWLKEIDEKCMFWLDAHPNNPSDKIIPNQILSAELNVIKEHSFKEHTILVDDIPVYFDEEDVKNQILEINSNYKFELRDGNARPQSILCARI